MPDLPTDFFRQNEWANLTLLEACRGLTEEQLDATSTGTYGSIRDTLIHILSAEAGYARTLGREPSPRARYDDPWPGFDALVEMASAAADALVAVSKTESDRVVRTGDQRFDVEAGVILVQAFHHSTEHRSQINTILTTLGIEPPDLSSWDWGLAVDRMRRV